MIDRVKVRADYTFTRAVDTDTGLQLLRRPKEKFSVTAIWNPIDPLTFRQLSSTSAIGPISTEIQACRLTAPGYTIVNLRADYAINDQLKVFGRIETSPTFTTRIQPDSSPPVLACSAASALRATA